MADRGRRRVAVRLAWVVAVGVALAVSLGACSAGGGDDAPISGIVTEVTGDLTTVESFVVLDGTGRSHKFVPADGLLFYGGPLTHLRDHVVTGQPITVTFVEGFEGEKTATLIEHVGGEEHEDMDMNEMGGDGAGG